MSLGAPVTLFEIEIYFIMIFIIIVVTIFGIFLWPSLPCDLHCRLSVHKEFWFCKCTTPWMFPPLRILLEYWIEYVSFGLLYVILHSLLGYSTGEFQVFQLIVMAAFGAVD